MPSKPLPPSAIAKILKASVPDKVNPASVLETVLTLYANQPSAGYDPSEDGDMLLFQYGVSDWGSGPAFEVDFTRQFYKPDKILQLRCTLYYPPADGKGLPSWNLWSSEAKDLETWRNQVADSPGFKIVRDRIAARIRIELDRQ